MTATPLNDTICKVCPLGPEPRKHPACERCLSDIRAIDAREAAMAPPRQEVYRGVDYTRALAYDLLPPLIANEHPD